MLSKESYTTITIFEVSSNYIYAADKTGMKIYKLNLDGDIIATYNTGGFDFTVTFVL